MHRPMNIKLTRINTSSMHTVYVVIPKKGLLKIIQTLATLQCIECSIVLVDAYIKYTDLLSSMNEIVYLIFI